jgi:hypothetical protein
MRHFVIAGAAVVVAACAGPQVPAPPGPEALAARGWVLGPEVGSVRDFSIGGFETLDETHLVIAFGSTHGVLVGVGPGCTGLRGAQRIGHDGLPGTLARLDRLLVLAPGLPAQCVVESIRRLERAG